MLGSLNGRNGRAGLEGVAIDRAVEHEGMIMPRWSTLR
jgi:hypothetical protein